MLQRYCALRPLLLLLDYAKVEKLFLTEEEVVAVNRFVKRSTDFEFIIPQLRFDATLLSDARALFDRVDNKDRSFKHRINGRDTIDKMPTLNKKCQSTSSSLKWAEELEQKAILHPHCSVSNKSNARSWTSVSVPKWLLKQLSC